MTPSRPYRIVPDPDDRRFMTVKYTPRPWSPGAQRALEIQLAGIARWLEERRRRLTGGQDNPTN